MKKVMLLWVLFVMALTACAVEAPVELPTEISAALDAYAVQNPYTNGYEIARRCAAQPTALYWHEGAQKWAVICLLNSSPTYGNTYGAVMLDVSKQVIHTERISAASFNALDELVVSVGWERR